MEDEIDLRAYLEVLIRHWKLIIGLAVLAAVAAFVVSSFLPRTYEASALVLVTEPRYQIQFDPRFGTEERTPAYRAFPTMATSDTILQTVLDQWQPEPGSELNGLTLGGLSGMVSASAGSDPSLLALSVQAPSPGAAAAIANLWADVLVREGNRIYGDSETDVAFFESQLVQAESALDNAETALVEFQARNEQRIVAAQLGSLQQAQTDYLTYQRTIAYIIQDIQSLRSQLAEQSSSQPASVADSLTALLLQIRAFNALDSTGETTPIQLQIDSAGSFSDQSVAEQVDFLDGLVRALQSKATEIEMRLTELEPEILVLQERYEEASNEANRLTRARDVAQETYLTLARKLEEARIGAQEANGTLYLASYAAVPGGPVAPRRLFNTVVAGMLGLAAGVVLAFAIEFWRQNGRQKQEG